MCNLVQKIEGNSAHIDGKGYKIVVKKDGNYYSPTTGIQYKIGEVEIPKIQKNYVMTISSEILDPESIAYSENMIGRTCVFIDYLAAKERIVDWQMSCKEKLVIVKMTVSKQLMLGTYGSALVIGGREIFYINEIYDETN